MGTGIELTQEKKDFLADMSLDKERVQKGELTSSEKEILREYDLTMKYLQEKYPSHTFRITSYDPKMPGKEFSTYQGHRCSTFYVLADELEEVFHIYNYGTKQSTPSIGTTVPHGRG